MRVDSAGLSSVDTAAYPKVRWASKDIYQTELSEPPEEQP